MKLYYLLPVLIIVSLVFIKPVPAETKNDYSASIQSLSKSVADQIKKNSGFSFFTKIIAVEFPELDQSHKWNVFYDRLNASLREAFISSGFSLPGTDKDTIDCKKSNDAPDYIAQISAKIYEKAKQVKIIATVYEMSDEVAENSFVVSEELPARYFNDALKEVSTIHMPGHVYPGTRIKPFTEIDAVCQSVAQSFKCKISSASAAWNKIYKSSSRKSVDFNLLHYRFLGLTPADDMDSTLVDKITLRLYNQLCNTGLSINAGFRDIESVLDQVEMYQDLPLVYKSDQTAGKIQLVPSQVIILGDITMDDIRPNQYLISLRAAVTSSDLQGVASQGFMVPQLVVRNYFKDVFPLTASEKINQYWLVYKAYTPQSVPEDQILIQQIKRDLKAYLGNSKIKLLEKPGNLLNNFGTIAFSISLSSPEPITDKYSVSIASLLLKSSNPLRGHGNETVVNQTEKLIFRSDKEISEHKLYNLLKKMVPTVSKEFLEKL